MANIDPQLVRQIAERVIAALNAPAPAPGRGPGSAAGGAGSSPADVRPPAGVCTGDYSKFIELGGRPLAAPPQGEPRPEAQPEPARGQAPEADAEPAPPPAPALTGIVTADQLRDAMKAAPDGVATLAHDTRLTPLAQDLAREEPGKIRRVARAAADHPQGQKPWFWWADGHCPAAQSVVADLRGRVAALTADRSNRGLLHVARELARRVKAGDAAGGVLFVDTAASAACYANRCRALRAVVGTREEAVEQAIRDLGANVLIIEYPTTNPQRMRAMVERIVRTPGQAPPQIARDLRDLEEGA